MTGKQLKNSILQWAIQGKLVPQDPNDELASVLLEKIRAKKARLVKEGKIKKDKKESIIYRGEDNSYYEKFADGKVVCIDDEIPFEIPNGWEWSRIREISQSYIGLTYKPSDVSVDGTIVLRSSNIQNGKISLHDIVRVSAPISEKLWVEKNDIIICARNGSRKLVGKSAIIDTVDEPMTFGAFMAICKTPLYRYVHTYLQSDLFFSQLRVVSGTTTINQLTQNNFNSFLIPVPPMQEQQRICTKLSEVLPFVERYGICQEKQDMLNNKINDLLKKSILQEAIQGRLVRQDVSEESASILLQRIREEKLRLVAEGKLKKKDVVDSVIFKGDDNRYYEKVGKTITDITDEIPFDIPKGWEWCRLSHIASVSGGKRIPVGAQLTTLDTGHKYIRVSDMKNSSVKLDDIHYITEDIYQQIKAYTISKNDLYITVAGTIGSVGEIPDSLDMANLTENADKIVFSIVNKRFLMYLLQSELVQRQIKACTTKVGQPKLAIMRIQNFLLAIPPLTEQQRIVNLIEQIYSEIKG